MRWKFYTPAQPGKVPSGIFSPAGMKEVVRGCDEEPLSHA